MIEFKTQIHTSFIDLFTSSVTFLKDYCIFWSLKFTCIYSQKNFNTHKEFILLFCVP